LPLCIAAFICTMDAEAMRLQQSSDEESDELQTQSSSIGVRASVLGLVVAAIVGIVVFVGGAHTGSNALASNLRVMSDGIISAVSNDTEEETTEEETTSASTKAPASETPATTEAPASEPSTAAPSDATTGGDETAGGGGEQTSGDDSSSGDEGAKNHLSEECMKEIIGVFDPLIEAYKSYEEKCAGVNMTNKDEIPTDCSHALNSYWREHYTMPDLKNGKCMGHEDWMQCNITQIINGTDFSHEACLHKVCKPENVLKNGIQEEQKLGLCEEGADCKIEVACKGHPVASKQMGGAPRGQPMGLAVLMASALCLLLYLV